MSEAVDVATFQIAVGGIPVGQIDSGRVRSIQVVEDLNALSTFTIELSCWDAQSGGWAWDDAGPFPLGTRVDIRLGFLQDVASVMIGEVTEHQLQMGAGSSPSLTVHGYSPLHRLERGVFSRSWPEASETTILQTIASDHGLLASATDLPAMDTRIAQLEQSDYQWLSARAARLGYDLYYADGAIQYHPKVEGGAAAVTLSAQRDVVSFSARMSTRDQVDTVVVYYKAGEEASPVELVVPYDGPDDAGPNVAASLFQSARIPGATRTLDDKDEAQTIADARLNAIADRFITANISCRGHNALRAGAIVEIPDVGSRFSGTYLVTRVTHSLAAGSTYQTSLAARRQV